LTLNLKTEKGKNLFKDLVEESDILIENFRPGLLNELSLGYEVLKEINPQLIMISISGYGQTGPKSSKTAFDMTVLADSGLMSLTGEEGGIPMKMGTAISDFLAGVYGALGALVSIINRNKTGMGQYVDVSMLDCLLSIYETSISESRK
jgi:CoA:oxalate CoA-transferase